MINEEVDTSNALYDVCRLRRAFHTHECDNDAANDDDGDDGQHGATIILQKQLTWSVGAACL
jgi:hypothetical protein